MKTFLLLVALAVCFSAYAASDSRGGAWTAEVDGESLQVTMFSGKHSRDDSRMYGNILGFNESLASFKGLSRTDAASSAANVQFELRRPAGTIGFEGRFSDGTGAGHFRFTPSDAFVRDMESLGYSGFTDDQLIVFAVHGFSPQTIRDLRARGYQPTRREVEEIAIFGITAELLDAYAQLGYPNLTLREVVDLRVGRVDAAYITGMGELGYKGLSARQIANLAILGVRPAYVRELQSAGLSNLTIRELTDLRIGHITAERVAEYRKLGYTNLTAYQLGQMGILGVTPDYIRQVGKAGKANE